jgi:cyclopropane fatty-acyl-phospholipid synthase-like methyltransferase
MSAEWFVDLYDDFRRRTGFGAVSAEQTGKDVDFIWEVLGLRPGSKLLDLFCGTGRHSLELASRGCSPTGIELNPEYLAMARQTARGMAHAPTFIEGDVRAVDFGREYDAAIVMFHSFGYFSDSEDREVLRRVFDALKAGGRFLIEILSREWILHNFIEVEDRMLEGIRVVERRQFDPLTNRSNFTIQRFEPGGVVTKQGSWRLYSADEVRHVLEGLGFRFAVGYADLDKAPLTRHTRLMRLVLVKE